MNRIAETRRERGISQQDLATASGIQREYLSRLENGHTLPTIPTARKIAEALNCTLDDLYPTTVPIEAA